MISQTIPPLFCCGPTFTATMSPLLPLIATIFTFWFHWFCAASFCGLLLPPQPTMLFLHYLLFPLPNLPAPFSRRLACTPALLPPRALNRYGSAAFLALLASLDCWFNLHTLHRCSYWCLGEFWYLPHPPAEPSILPMFCSHVRWWCGVLYFSGLFVLIACNLRCMVVRGLADACYYHHLPPTPPHVLLLLRAARATWRAA